MGKEREDIRAALQLLLTPKQYAYIMRSRGRSPQQLLRLLVQDGIRYHCGTVMDRERWYQDAKMILRGLDLDEDLEHGPERYH